MNNAESFHLEARYQGVCAACQRAGSFEAHHVLERQLLKRERRPQCDPRNALRLCDELAGNCHNRHTRKLRPVKTTELTDDNIIYAFEELGDYAYDYLRRHYEDQPEDPRLISMLIWREFDEPVELESEVPHV